MVDTVEAVVAEEEASVVEEEASEDPVTTAVVVMAAAGASAGRVQGTLGLGTGSVTLPSAGTPTSAGGTSATSARRPSRRGLAETEEVRFSFSCQLKYFFLMIFLTHFWEKIV